MRIGFLIAGVALAAAIVFGLNYFLSDPETEVVEQVDIVDETDELEPAPLFEPEVLQPTPRAPEPVAEPVVLPVLNSSDPFVRDALAESELPADWLAQEDLLRRLAVVIENAQRGEYPRRQLGFLAPEGRFEVIETEDETLYVDPRSYQRYDVYLDRLESIPPGALATLLVNVSPLLNEALQELGVEDASLSGLVAAIDNILEVPVLRQDVELVQPKVFFEYADPVLESMTPLQKQVLRMGPDNVERLQPYLVELRAQLLD